MIVTNTTLHEHLPAHRAGALYPIDVIHTDGIDQPSNYILLADPLIISVFNVGGNECRALVVEIRRPTALQCPVSNLFHFDAQRLPGGLFKEGAGAGGAGLIHGVIAGNSVGNVSVFGILTADFEDGIYIFIEMNSGLGMSDDFIIYAVGECVQSGYFPTRAGDP